MSCAKHKGDGGGRRGGREEIHTPRWSGAKGKMGEEPTQHRIERISRRMSHAEGGGDPLKLAGIGGEDIWSERRAVKAQEDKKCDQRGDHRPRIMSCGLGIRD